MRVYLTTALILLLTYLPAWITETHATHIKGYEIWYECSGGCTYTVHGSAFTYCDQTYNLNTAPTGFQGFASNISWSGIGPGCTPPTPLTSWQYVGAFDISFLCPGTVSACVDPLNGFPIGVMEIEYARDYDLCGMSCSQYVLSTTECCRTATITSGAGNQNLYLEIGPIDLDSCNTSARFLYSNELTLCSQTSDILQLGAYDPDGDSLVYSLVNCLQAPGTSVTYNVGYSASQPLGPSWNVSLNSQSGDLTVTAAPGNIVVGVICIQVDEYRNGQLLGSITRDNLITVVSCPPVTNTPPYVQGPLVMTGGGFGSAPNHYRASVGLPFCMWIEAIDPDPNDPSKLWWDHGIPGAAFYDLFNPLINDTVSGVDPIGEFCWTPSATGTYAFIASTGNPNCANPIGSIDHQAFVIEVDNCNLQVDLGADTASICVGDQAVITPLITGGTPPYQYIWSNGANTPSIVVTSPGTYQLFLIDANNCTSSDFIEIVHYDTLAIDAGPDTSLCLGGVVFANVMTLQGTPVSWQWTPATGLSNPNVTNPAISPSATTTYLVQAVDNNGCTAIDSFTVTVGGMAVDAGVDTTVCPGDSVTLLAQTSGGIPPLQYLWSTGATTQSLLVNSPGTYFVDVTDNSGCPGTDTVVVFNHDACVWPGDADNDGVANNQDLLAIGLAYGNSGPIRSNASLNWNPQPAFQLERITSIRCE